MQLYLDSFGASLHLKNGQFAVRTKTADETLFPTNEVSAILLTRGTAASTDTMLLALELAIPVIFLDENTHFPKGQAWSGAFGSISTIRKNQAIWAQSAAGFEWAAQILARKIGHQRELLRFFSEKNMAAGIDNAPKFEAERIRADPNLAATQTEFSGWKPPVAPGFDADLAAAFFRGKEGSSTRSYWQMLGWLVPGDFQFGARSKRPAWDPFNALLNYLYGMLYTQVQLAVMKAGLDPAMAVLHADGYGGRPSFVFDFIEPFRGWADRVALELVLGGQVALSDFDEESPEKGWRLSPGRPGKGAAIAAFLAFLNEKTLFSGQMARRAAQIDIEAVQLANRLKNWGA